MSAPAPLGLGLSRQYGTLGQNLSARLPFLRGCAGRTRRDLVALLRELRQRFPLTSAALVPNLYISTHWQSSVSQRRSLGATPAMESTNTTTRPDQSQETNDGTRPPSCPHCGGTLFQLRGILRCARCYFAICEGCEGGEQWGGNCG